MKCALVNVRADAIRFLREERVDGGGPICLGVKLSCYDSHGGIWLERLLDWGLVPNGPLICAYL